MDSFGKHFGELVRTRRGIEGLSQQELAVRAFGDETRKTRISELENGKVPNPQQRTVDALVTALDIPAKDLAACRTPAANDLPPEIHDELAAGLLENLSMRFGHDNPDATRAELRAYLQEKARDYKALKDRLDEIEQGEESQGRLDNQLAAADAAIRDGHFEEADEILAGVEEIQQAEHTLAQVRQQAKIRTTRGVAALLKGDPDTAYTHFAAAAGFFDPFDPLEGGRIRNDYVNRLWRHGERFADAAMQRAVDLARRNTTVFSRRENPEDWAMAHGSLGNALQTLGDRESGTARLAEAVAAYRAALQEYTRERVPVQWAMTQNNLGSALWTLGERESGTARLEEAVAAYRDALEEHTRERVPLDWAMTQNNLGNALWTLGERESGTARLEEAVTAYRAALQEYTRDRVPLDWAMTQNNLGNALRTLGQRESGTARLEEAVAAYRAALEERTRERIPLDWAMTQNNLGNALQTLGERETGTARLEEAVDAYRDALAERTRDRVPLDWAMTQNNLGNALQTLGERETGTARLEEACAAYRAALEEITRDRMSLGWGITRMNLAKALALLGERKSDRSVLTAALAAMQDARTVHVDEAGMAHAAEELDGYITEIEAIIESLG